MEGRVSSVDPKVNKTICECVFYSDLMPESPKLLSAPLAYSHGFRGKCMVLGENWNNGYLIFKLSGIKSGMKHMFAY